jgi:hypothetical protein
MRSLRVGLNNICFRSRAASKYAVARFKFVERVSVLRQSKAWKYERLRVNELELPKDSDSEPEGQLSLSTTLSLRAQAGNLNVTAPGS